MRAAFPSRARTAAALTLIELVIVLVILAALAGMLVPLFGDASDDGRQKAALATLRAVQETIAGTPQSPGYWADMRALPRPNVTVEPGRQDHPQLRYLFVNPATVTGARSFDPDTMLGWRGPYITMATGRYVVDDARGFTRDFGENDDLAVLDPWGNAIVIDLDATLTTWQLVSAGDDGVLDTSDDQRVDLLTAEVTP